MNLRAQLSLFFGGLLLLVLTLLIGANYTRLYSTLESSMTEQFSLEPYMELAKLERSLLKERANALVDRPQVLNGIRFANNLVTKEGMEGLDRVRRDTESEGFFQLNSAYGQMLQLLDKNEDSDGQDLAVLVDPDANVIVESIHKKFKDGDLLPPSVESLADLSFLGRGYLLYPNKKLYLYSTADFAHQNMGDLIFEGLALVGKELDREFLTHIINSDDTDEGTQAIVVHEGGVVGSSEQARFLGLELANNPTSEKTWRSSTGRDFLVKHADLKSYYLTEREKTELQEQGLLDQMPAAETVGRVYLLRDVAPIKEAAFEGTRDSLILGVMALLGSLLAVPLIARHFTRPIGELTEAMSSVGEGNLEPLGEDKISSITEVKEAAQSFNEMIIGLKQKKVLETFVPEGTRKEIEALQGRTSELGGKRWERTIMFSDLRGFTSMSESMSPDEVMAVLNKYLHVMSRAIRLNGGDINEYIGDAILAVFESPDAAVKASIAMNDELEELRKDRSIDALAGLGQGIGLHTGPLVEGNIGEENRRLKRAVVGDTVNLAARIQDRSRDGSYSCIFISQDTKDKLTEEVELVHFGDEEFKGKAEPVPVWEIKL